MHSAITATCAEYHQKLSTEPCVRPATRLAARFVCMATCQPLAAFKRNADIRLIRMAKNDIIIKSKMAAAQYRKLRLVV
ncbi:hypothetical protein D3C73_1553240 [compost metagenome]